MAALQKDLSVSTATARKIITPVKSPSPSRRAAETRELLEIVPPPFKHFTDKYQSGFGAELQSGVVYSGRTERMYEDWGAQVCNLAQRAGSKQDKKT